jgi:hypothetical protein
MYTPEAALRVAKVILVGLNPGGDQIDPTSVWEHRGVNAYADQPWGEDGGLNRLQVQVGYVFDALGVEPKEVFAANFVPFRSPSWDQLPDKEGALCFGRKLWSGLLPHSSGRLFVTLGKLPGRELGALLNATCTQRKPVQWGRQTIDEYIAVDGRTVLALPHLSRFRIFGGARTAANLIVSAARRRVQL